MKRLFALTLTLMLMSFSLVSVAAQADPDFTWNQYFGTSFVDGNSLLRGSEDIVLINDLASTCNTLSVAYSFYVNDNMEGMDVAVVGNQLIAQNRDGNFKGEGTITLVCADSGDAIAQQIPITVVDQLTVVSIDGYEQVTQGDTQFFELEVQNHLNEPVNDAQVSVSINEDDIGFCSTDNDGECDVQYVIPRALEGEVTAYATAIKDGFFLPSQSVPFTFTVEALNPDNEPPVWEDIGAVDVNGAVQINLDNYARDPEGDDLTYTFEDGSTVVDDAASPIFGSKIVDNILTLFSQVIGEVVDVLVRATDGDGASAATSFKANLNDNQIPAFSFGISADKTQGEAPLTVTFSAVDNYGFGNVEYEWDFDNDGTIDDTGRVVSYTFDDADDYTVKAYGKDGLDRTATAEIGIEVFGDVALDARPFDAPRDVLHVSNVNVPNQGMIDPNTATLSFTISVANDGSEELEDIHIRAIVPDLGLRGRSIKFDLNPGEETHERVRIETSGAIEPGYYLVHFSISNDDYYREVNREIWVQ